MLTTFSNVSVVMSVISVNEAFRVCLEQRFTKWAGGAANSSKGGSVNGSDRILH